MSINTTGSKPALLRGSNKKSPNKSLSTVKLPSKPRSYPKPDQTKKK